MEKTDELELATLQVQQLIEKGQIIEASALALLTLRKASAIQHPSVVPNLYAELCVCELTQFDYLKSLEFAQLAYDSLQANTTHQVKVKVLYYIGLAYSNMNDKPAEHRYMVQCLQLAETEPSNLEVKEYMAAVYHSLAKLYDFLHLTDLATEAMHQSLQISEQIENSHLLLYNYSLLGQHYFGAKNYDLANHYFDQVLQKKKDGLLNEQFAVALQYKGLIKMKTGFADQAEDLLVEAYQLRKQIGNEFRLMSSYYNLCIFYFQTGKVETGNEFYTKTIDFIEKYDHQLDTKEKVNIRVNLLKERGDYREAFELLDASGLKFTDSNLLSGIMSEAITVERDKQLHIREQSDELRQINNVMNDHAQKLEMLNKDLSTFAQVTSHDLREPLRMVSTYMGILEIKLKEKLNEEEKMFLHFAVDGSKRMDEMITRILESAKGSAVSKPISLAKVLQQVKINLQQLMDSKAAVIQVQDLPIVTGSEVQFLQIFQNLISNAIKYNNSPVPQVIITSKTEPDSYIIEICDNGVGIPEHERLRAFELFERVENSSGEGGTGIGLSTVKNIIEKLQGKIYIKANEPQGSIFVIKLPLK